MTAELSSRPDGKPRHPWDWYVEQSWVTHVLLDHLKAIDAGIEADVPLLDPFCGLGTIPLALRDRGLEAYGTDMFTRSDGPHFLGEHDFLGDQRHLLEMNGRLSVIMNPPFSYQNGQIVRGLAERCIRRALEIATHKVVALVPLKWLGSTGRYRLFSEMKPQVHVLSERPSMPPGDEIEALGKNAWARGKVDYMWLVFDKHSPATPHAPTFWIPPRADQDRGRQP